jgi:hypothetical protein
MLNVIVAVLIPCRNFLENFVLSTEFEPYYHRQIHIIHR